MCPPSLCHGVVSPLPSKTVLGLHPLSHGQCLGASPLAPQAGAGVKQAQPSLTDGMWLPRFWAAGEPGEWRKTRQGFVFLGCFIPHKEVLRCHGAAALWLSATVVAMVRLSRAGEWHPSPWVTHQCQQSPHQPIQHGAESLWAVL